MVSSLPSAAASQRPRSHRLLGVGAATALQIAALAAFSLGCNAAAAALHSPIPGSIAGFVLLYLLLEAKIVRPQWIEGGASLLSKHLSLFIVPITVGVMALGPLLASLGWALFAALFASAAVGLALSGSLAQALAARKRRRK
ncbi:MAG: CidA/LrgA family protein [Vulcanimicrobiaceae bacterium]